MAVLAWAGEQSRELFRAETAGTTSHTSSESRQPASASHTHTANGATCALCVAHMLCSARLNVRLPSVLAIRSHSTTFAKFGPGPARRVVRRPPDAAAGAAPGSYGQEGGRAAGRACPRSRRSSKSPALVAGHALTYACAYCKLLVKTCSEVWILQGDGGDRCIGVEVGATHRAGRGQGWGMGGALARPGGEWMTCAATGPPVSTAGYAIAAAVASCSLASRDCPSTRGLR